MKPRPSPWSINRFVYDDHLPGAREDETRHFLIGKGDFEGVKLKIITRRDPRHKIGGRLVAFEIEAKPGTQDWLGGEKVVLEGKNNFKPPNATLDQYRKVVKILRTALQPFRIDEFVVLNRERNALVRQFEGNREIALMLAAAKERRKQQTR